MTILFIIFTLLVALLLLPSQLGAQTTGLQDVKTSLNVRLEQLKKDFQFRSRELARRLKSADLDKEEWQKLNDELQIETRSSIDSTRVASQSEKTNSSALMSIVLIVLIVAISFAAYQFSGSQELVEQQIKISKLLEDDPLTIEKLSKKAQSAKSQDALYEFYLALRTKVDKMPSNIESWRDLASFNADYGRISEARAAMKVAMSIEPDNLFLKTDLAQILLGSKNQQDLFYSRQLIQQVLEEQPENQDALFLLGQNSFQFGMFKRAIRSWEQLLEISKPGSAMANLVKKQIDRARELLNKPDEKQSTVKDTTTTNSSSSRLIIKLTIPESIQSRLSGKETLFIFAKAVEGPAFPLAAIKTTVDKHAKEIVLSDKNAMQAEHTLSKYDKIIVIARISMAGITSSTEGDIQGQSEIISKPFPTSAITVVIDDDVN